MSKWKPTMQIRQALTQVIDVWGGLNIDGDLKKSILIKQYKLQQLWEEWDNERNIMGNGNGSLMTILKTGKTEWRDVPVVEGDK